MSTKRQRATHTCFACGECIEGEKPMTVEDNDGSIWHSHSKDECFLQTLPTMPKQVEP